MDAGACTQSRDACPVPCGALLIAHILRQSPAQAVAFSTVLMLCSTAVGHTGEAGCSTWDPRQNLEKSPGPTQLWDGHGCPSETEKFPPSWSQGGGRVKHSSKIFPPRRDTLRPHHCQPHSFFPLLPTSPGLNLNTGVLPKSSRLRGSSVTAQHFPEGPTWLRVLPSLCSHGRAMRSPRYPACCPQQCQDAQPGAGARPPPSPAGGSRMRKKKCFEMSFK